MFKISDFSRLTRVSMKTLRHYDEIGLFKPASVDRFTGYRFYSYEQLPHLNRILVLKGLGFSLDAIGQMLDGELEPAELRGMLRLRKAQLEQEAEKALEMLKQVEIRLRQIEQEGNVPQIDVLLKQIEPLTIAGAREVVPAPSQMRERCIALNKQVWELIESAGLKTDGVSFVLYYSGEEGEAGIDVEMAYVIDIGPLKALPDASEQTKARVHALPAVMVAYSVYNGSYDDFGAVGQVHGALNKWISENGYRVVDAPREFYLRLPTDPNNPVGVMEIQYPVEKV